MILKNIINQMIINKIQISKIQKFNNKLNSIFKIKINNLKKELKVHQIMI